MAKSREAAEQLAQLTIKIRRDIIFGAYAPGTWLKLGDLQQQYEASAFHIRRALDQLKNDKLVDHVANAGFRVATLDVTARAETLFVRTVLERSAAHLITARANADDIAELRRLAELFDASITEEGRQAQASTNHNFHAYLYSVTGNAVLCETISEMRNRSGQFTAGRWRSVEGLQASSRDHFAIITAIEERDPYEVEQAIISHIKAF
ncbi:GntR family transcriptional regulator [Mesorhizobium sp. YR577]|uniref:GntR family transcriptional regulator n=1 Tax=Mesorhizobium sp. YR577 TaxID=1884373 RepID=UPI0008EBC8E0|nr:GntR family transcriptional regulator [Mesorhizobium sp. YR577]SFU23153.1 DNA-binding transcriptional regulator, GntR family [Mesorhizobium sp. YR577]